jgi:hypothetical protein
LPSPIFFIVKIPSNFLITWINSVQKTQNNI